MKRERTAGAIALLWVLFLSAWATAARAQRPVAPHSPRRPHPWRAARLPPPAPVFVWRLDRIAPVGGWHGPGWVYGPVFTYSPRPRPGHYGFYHPVTQYFYSPLTPGIYLRPDVVPFPRSDGEREGWVAEWRDREPSVGRPVRDFSQSALLQEGMSEEEIVRAVGSPIYRRRAAEGEVWKYSSFSLVVGEGKLKAMH